MEVSKSVVVGIGVLYRSPSGSAGIPSYQILFGRCKTVRANVFNPTCSSRVSFPAV